MYGPTETTVWSTIHRVRDATGPISIGRPIDNTTIYLLDRHLNPVPIGAPGELHIGGDGLARGYLNRPDLTAEKFIRDPFSPDASARIYKTGDVARYFPDGTIECLGRTDHQVKVRGYRIELGEIETVLGQHPGVRSTVVVARKDERGVDYLVGYVIPRPDADASLDSLRKALKAKVPEYMVPSYFVTLDAWPLTPNGKIDRKALPEPSQSGDGEARTIVPPKTDPERALAPIWEEVLKVKPISITDNFFDLGGHSFLAAVLLAKIRTQLGHTLPLGTLFTAPTIQQLAALIQKNLEAPTVSPIVPLHEEGEQPPLFLIAGVGGHVFTFHKFARMLDPRQPTYGVKAIGIDGTRPPLDRIEDIAAEYVKEITALRPKGPFMLGGYSVGAIVAYELALQLRQLGHQISLLVVFDMNAPGYPKKLPLPRRVMMHLGNFARLGLQEKKSYLVERFGNVKTKVLRRLGLGVLNAPEIPGVEALPQDAIKRVWAALVEAQLRYEPRAKLDTSLILFKAEEAEEWAATIMDDPLAGWGQWVKGSIEEHTIPGGHMEIFHDRNIDLVAKKLRGAIHRALKAGKG
jgi:thioesterase domain-containing protein